GEEVITAEYEQLFLHDIPMHGYIYAKHGGQWGVIDQQGREVKPFIYDEIGSANPNHDSLIAANLNGARGYMNKNFEWVIEPKKGRYFPGQFFEDMIPVKENGKTGYMNPDGEIILPIQYEAGNNFGEGLAPVKFNRSDTVWYYVDRNGNKIKEIDGYMIGGFKNGVAHVSVEGDTEAYINREFNIIFEGEYGLNEFHEKYATITTRDGNYYFGMVDTNGKLIFEPTYEYLQYKQEYDLVIFAENGLEGIMTPEGEVIFSPQFKDIDKHFTWKMPLILVEPPKGKEGYIDLNGKKYYED
ncbi:MAG: WG repeat-containing protein, partial [Cyclobacteriaceae bacterium]